MDISSLEDRIGRQFKRQEIIVQALTHRSYANERQQKVPDNEVLEFLGDAVLGLVVSDILYHRYPYLSEGPMSKLKSFLVSADTLAVLADQLGIGDHILLGRGEEKTHGRAKNSILANAFEAVIAAIYLDGGLKPANDFLFGQIEPLLDDTVEVTRHLGDFKSVLQERVQAEGLPLPTYTVISENGPDHDKEFLIEVDVAGTWRAEGRGKTKKGAEQKAACKVLGSLVPQPACEAEIQPPPSSNSPS